MWVEFDKIEYQKGIMSQKGTVYDGYVATGTKRGYQGEPDAPWRKIFFDTQATTIIERGLNRPGCSIVEFLQKGVKHGDTLCIRSEREGAFWRIISMENIAGSKPTYEPLPDSGTGPLQDAGAPRSDDHLNVPSFLKDATAPAPVGPSEGVTDHGSEVPF